uniref:ORF9 n=1 Tax=Amycolatopsis benzoatilytica TaxID=346045 RepID=A3FG42_9PSEU|nr:ORF9 [Amycolatopsis benzoatilytica]
MKGFAGRWCAVSTLGATIPTRPRCGPVLPACDTRTDSPGSTESAILTLKRQPVSDLCVSCGRAPGVPRPTPLRTVHCGPCWAEFGGSPTSPRSARPRRSSGVARPQRPAGMDNEPGR